MYEDFAKRMPDLRRARLVRASPPSKLKRRRAAGRPAAQRPLRTSRRRGLIRAVLLCAAIAGLLVWFWPEGAGDDTALPAAPHLASGLPLGLGLPPSAALPGMRLSHTVKRGETLGSIFSRYGLPVADAAAVHAELQRISKEEGVSGSIRRGQQLMLVFAEDGPLSEVRSSATRDTELLIGRSPEGGFTAKVKKLPKVEKERLVAGEISSSFALAANSAGLPYDAIDNLVDLFSDRIAFHRDFRKGDRFSVIFNDSVLSDGTSLQRGSILAAVLEVNGHSYIAVRYLGSDGVYRYFDGDGEVLGNSFLRYPLKFTRISSYFNKSRFHPVLKRRRPHNGVDFAAPTGTPVRSVADGRITWAGRKGGGGLTVKIQHTRRYSTAYLHLSRIAKGIRKGSRVKRGQQIGAVGMTGLATGPHLHYSFYDRGRYVDPLKIKLPKVEELKKGQKIDDVYLRRVLYTLNHYQRINLDDFYWN